jgi:hypothetical protein
MLNSTKLYKLVEITKNQLEMQAFAAVRFLLLKESSAFGSLIFVGQGNCEGGLFDFNATLPLLALFVILLIVLLTFIFYQPFDFVLKLREYIIGESLVESSARLNLGFWLMSLNERTAKARTSRYIKEIEKDSQTFINVSLNYWKNFTKTINSLYDKSDYYILANSLSQINQLDERVY